MAEVSNEYIAAQLERVLEGQRDHTAQFTAVRGMLRRIEDRLDRHDELVLSLLQSDRDLEKRLRLVERSRED